MLGQRVSREYEDWDLDDLPLGITDPSEARASPAPAILPFPDRPPPEATGSEKPSALRWQWMAEVEAVDPGALLADGLMVPEGVTVLYGPGDVGKGHVACEAIRHLVRQGPILILDYETHPSEWRRRLGMMLSPEHLGKVAHIVPDKSLPKEADALHDLVADIGAHAIILDSYQAATPDGKVHAEQADVPREMFRALARIGVPALVLAHVTKSGGDHQPYPYGSVFVHNYARMTWSAGKLSQEDEPLRVELRCRKSNDRTPELPRVYEFTYAPDGLRVTREMMLTHGEAIALVLGASDKPMTPAAIFTALDYQGLLWEGATVDNIGSLLRADRKGRFTRHASGWLRAG